MSTVICQQCYVLSFLKLILKSFTIFYSGEEEEPEQEQEQEPVPEQEQEQEGKTIGEFK